MKKMEIEFVVDAQGNIRSTVRGVKGSACVGMAEAFRALGDVIEEKRTGEYYEARVGAGIRVATGGER